MTNQFETDRTRRWDRNCAVAVAAIGASAQGDNFKPNDDPMTPTPTEDPIPLLARALGRIAHFRAESATWEQRYNSLLYDRDKLLASNATFQRLCGEAQDMAKSAQDERDAAIRQRDAANARYDEVLAVLNGENPDTEFNEAATKAKALMRGKWNPNP